MTAKFGCCKKDFKNLVCLGCFNIFHVSCLQKNTTARINQGHTIFCSKNCESKVNDSNTDELLNKIHVLKNDLFEKEEVMEKMRADYLETIKCLEFKLNKVIKDSKEKEAFYTKKINTSQKFEEEVLECEQEYADNVKKLTDKIDGLQQKIIDLNIRNEELISEIKKNERFMQDKIKDVEDLTKLNRNMINSIRILEDENLILTNEMERLQKNTERNDCVSMNTTEINSVCNNDQTFEGIEIEEAQNSDSIICGNERSSVSADGARRKILLIGDEFARYMPTWLHSFIDVKNYMVEGAIYPNMEILELSKMVSKHSLKYGSNDFIICIFNTLNISNHNTLNSAIHFLLPISKTTNLIVLSKCNNYLDLRTEYLFQKKVNNYLAKNRNISLFYQPIVGNIKSIIKNIVDTYIRDIMLKKSCNHIVLKTVQTNTTDFFRP